MVLLCFLCIDVALNYSLDFCRQVTRERRNCGLQKTVQDQTQLYFSLLGPRTLQQSCRMAVSFLLRIGDDLQVAYTVHRVASPLTKAESWACRCLDRGSQFSDFEEV